MSSQVATLRYVVLHHTGIPHAHFDLMIELHAGSELATWRCAHWPPRAHGKFEAIAPHRRDYLEYEGAVSGDRGNVKRVAAGVAMIVAEHGNELIVRLDDWELRLPRPGGDAVGSGAAIAEM
jgi:hypothetical protein